jgi:hypothetical protein
MMGREIGGAADAAVGEPRTGTEMHPDRSHGTVPVEGVVHVEPLISAEQREFIEGLVTAEDYVNGGQAEAEQKVRWEVARTRHRQVQGLGMLFVAIGSAVYLIVALAFLFTRHITAAIAALLISMTLMTFTVLVNRIAGLRREHQEHR